MKHLGTRIEAFHGNVRFGIPATVRVYHLHLVGAPCEKPLNHTALTSARRSSRPSAYGSG